MGQPHQLICKEGDVADSMYMIRKGTAAAFQGKSAKNIKSALLLTAGNGFDEIGLLADNVLRTASVVSLDWCDLGYITKQDFAALIEYFPKQRRLLEAFALEKIEEYKKAIKGRHERMPMASAWSSTGRNKLEHQHTGINEFLHHQHLHKTRTDSTGDTTKHSLVPRIDIDSNVVLSDEIPTHPPLPVRGQQLRSDISSLSSFSDLREQHEIKHQRTVVSHGSGTVSSLLRHSANEAKLRRNKHSQEVENHSVLVLDYLKRIDTQVRRNTEIITTHIESMTALSRQLTLAADDDNIATDDDASGRAQDNTLSFRFSSAMKSSSPLMSCYSVDLKGSTESGDGKDQKST